MTLRLNPDAFSQASDILKRGGIVAFPTETVYGLGGDATRAASIDAIFHAKGRPSDNPLIVHLHSADQLDTYCHSIPSLAYQLIAAFCPGPLTLVLPKTDRIVDRVTAGLKSVAVRFPSHPTARRMLEACDLPIAAPSANRSGRPSPTHWKAVLEDLDSRIDAVVCDGSTEIGLESTVIDLSRATPVVLRHGSVTLEDLRSIEPSIDVPVALREAEANSPGLRHRHYQPVAEVILCDTSSDIERTDDTAKGLEKAPRIAQIGLTLSDAEGAVLVKPCCDVEEYARSVFDFFRRCDAAKVDRIYCQRVPEIGLGRALMDRLRRAASR